MPYKMVFIVPVSSKKKKTKKMNATGDKECLSMDHVNNFTANGDLHWREKKRQKKDSGTNSKKMSVIWRSSLREN